MVHGPSSRASANLKLVWVSWAKNGAGGVGSHALSRGVIVSAVAATALCCRISIVDVLALVGAV